MCEQTHYVENPIGFHQCSTRINSGLSKYNNPDGLDYWLSDGYRHCATYKSDLDKIGNLDVIEGMWIFEERDILDNSLNKILSIYQALDVNLRIFN